MKVINTEKTDVVRFKNEVAVMEKLNALLNPNIIRYIESYVNEKQEYVIIMEYCSKGNLRDFIEEHKIKNKMIPENMILKFLWQILSGLNAAHKFGVIHRDVKPENIMIDSADNLKLSDFGISKKLPTQSIYANSAIGTMYYSCLEVIQGKNYNFSADIWSVGCLLHELCCFELPCSETDQDEFVKRLSEKYDPSAIPEEYSAELKMLIVSMLNPNGELRPTCENLLANKLVSGYASSSGIKTIYYESGDKYEGEYKNNKKNGKGTYYYTNGDRYEGEWINGKQCGTGVLYYANGDKYDGGWENNGRSGKGSLTYINGNKFEGEWKRNNKNGKGVFYYANGDIYKGEWEDGKMSSKGTARYSNGDRYEGGWRNNKKSGKGTFYHANGDVFEGVWKDGKVEGSGTQYYAEGDVYSGEWEDKMRSGRGVLNCANGDVYEGKWKEGKKNGKGVMLYSDGNKYEGEWKNNKRHGRGIFHFNNGDKQEGEWKDDKRNGIVIYYTSDGYLYEQEWKNGNLIDTKQIDTSLYFN
eukprot:TRINITY_DN1635_c0_g10_i1.p1 TRINITY_DN1635_c0_g10~~TRINITY_DN1635_c0_g10_i1.p1  ORF type:complete len:527 (+),score=113.99 TRINITY_DN1635_c0_g10_i1:200-1780(+)